MGSSPSSEAKQSKSASSNTPSAAPAASSSPRTAPTTYVLPQFPTDLAELAKMEPPLSLPALFYADLAYLWAAMKAGHCSSRLYAHCFAWTIAQRTLVPEGWGTRHPDFTDEEWQEYYEAAIAPLNEPMPTDAAHAIVLKLPYWPKPELPSFVWKMTQLQELHCYSSCITSMPPAIRHMTKLTELSPYTSYNLRYLPYEVTLTGLPKAHISLRALYAPLVKDAANLPSWERFNPERLVLVPEEPSFPTTPPTLREIVCRRLSGSNLEQMMLPQELREYMKKPRGHCSMCQCPFWEYEFRFWTIWSMDGVPLLARCCSYACANKSNEKDRIVWDGKRIELVVRNISRRTGPTMPIRSRYKSWTENIDTVVGIPPELRKDYEDHVRLRQHSYPAQ